ncbi:MAG: SDR family NAD(P)-dependent oxidoreductase [Marinobacter sp.]|uniref:SDR family NAD(P)-dependent oxidoreductase n=1 Tax=Marinobacter sp. TaxID=50741 RepID=UPI001B4462F0|nr:SDR family NAD(P)-dependent oxidoreductase [Marinobacter sp.]MBQ0748158.1 SDR family NAD(P)-dependent oxidoreductase [Marinobacter sp.]MBQ0815979.1 SDR family NAD(P)-dependent oxidoreductase [Marinobacter sp.]|tara:strand:- start:7781 stop:8128 length:348 start_codon:yes stop_codon:yes gene_type:complete
MTSWKHGAPRAAFISGGGSGIGLCLVKSLISEGTSVAVFDLRVDDSVVAELQNNARPSQKIEFYAADVTDPVAVEAAMEKAASDMSPPDLAINSAGMMRNGEFTVLPYETFERAV